MTEFGDLKTEEQVRGQPPPALYCVSIFMVPKLKLTPHGSGSKTPGHSEAHDAEKTEGGRGEEPRPQGGDHH